MTVATLDRSIKLESLRDATTVELRAPTLDDVERSLRFFRDLPASDRKYLRFDVTRREVVERLILEVLEGQARRILAFADDQVVGHGALRFSGDTWQSHIGELRVIVKPSHRRLGLGAILMAELFRAAKDHGVEKAIIRLAGPQIAVRTACERLGFFVDAVLRNHIKDADGKLQDLVVMSCDLGDVSRAMREVYREEFYREGD